jgi:hypothetical protein
MGSIILPRADWGNVEASQSMKGLVATIWEAIGLLLFFGLRDVSKHGKNYIVITRPLRPRPFCSEGRKSKGFIWPTHRTARRRRLVTPSRFFPRKARTAENIKDALRVRRWERRQFTLLKKSIKQGTANLCEVCFLERKPVPPPSLARTLEFGKRFWSTSKKPKFKSYAHFQPHPKKYNSNAEPRKAYRERGRLTK